MPQHFLTPYREPNKSAHQRAKGNLSYLEFVKVVQAMWADANPQIPILASGGDQHATYPVIIYSLQLRKPHPSEPKPRLREEIYTPPGEEAKIITGQRFQNIINFSVVTERDPCLAEELIEAFEDFMLEYTPVFKELGISEFVYARRLPDDEENRKGEGVCKRTVSYLVTTEKVIQTRVATLETVLVRARMILEEDPTFSVSEFSSVFRVYGISLKVGDYVRLGPKGAETFPSGVFPGLVYFVHTVIETSSELEYLFSERPKTQLELNPPTVEITGSGSGYLLVAPYGDPDAVDLELEDQFGGATPNTS